jgi:hypothetical protein
MQAPQLTIPQRPPAALKETTCTHVRRRNLQSVQPKVWCAGMHTSAELAEPQKTHTSSLCPRKCLEATLPKPRLCKGLGCRCSCMQAAVAFCNVCSLLQSCQQSPFTHGQKLLSTQHALLQCWTHLNEHTITPACTHSHGCLGRSKLGSRIIHTPCTKHTHAYSV